ncbi:MAG: amino acid ABC transporter permease [Planctomycetota bacterium]|jgi:L-cystine transport system permease protein|nr:amino acid ABC transporter permease [Planctomycetota bacterium]
MNLDYDFMLETLWLALPGILVTFEIALVASAAAVPVGLVLGIIRARRVPLLSQLARVYISFIRGTPLILQIFLVYNSFPSILAVVFARLGVEYNIFNLNPVVYAFIVFSISETAVLAEVFRAAITTVDKSQLEAAYSVGMTAFQGYRRIVIPQAMSAALPSLCNSITDLIKATSLAFTMSVMEITAIAKKQGAMKLSFIEAYLDIFLLYCILIFTVEKVLKILEKRARAYQQA